MIQRFPYIASRGFGFNKILLLQELLKMLKSKISSMITLDYYSGYDVDNYIVCSPETKVCLITNLTELWCRSNICSNFFYQLSQICNNIQSLIINSLILFQNGLTDLITSQNNLKSVTFESSFYENDDKVKFIISSLTKFNP
jgi:hypothetical protein